MAAAERQGSAFKEWFDAELNSESKSRSRLLIRLLMAVLMIAVILSCLFFGYKILSMDVYREIPALPRSDFAEEKAKAEAVVNLYTAIMEQRRDSHRIARDIIRIGRNPMEKQESARDIPLGSAEPSAQDLAELPPVMVIRAVIIMGANSGAVVDIDGVGYGIVVKKGTTFSGGKGKIVAIRPREVVFRWNGKNISVPVEL